jgi:hypothetical protein
LPQPNGHQRILKASREYSGAQEAVTTALLKLNKFLGVKDPSSKHKKKKGESS